MKMSRRALCLLALLLAVACDRNTPFETRPTPPPPPPSSGNRPPIPGTILGTSQAAEGWYADLAAVGASDPDGDSLYYTWDFGDGTTITGTYTHQIHKYIDNGTYLVVLTVTDSHGATGTTTKNLTITNAAPSVTAATLSAAQMPHSIPLEVTLHIEVADPGEHDNPSATIDWGDGTVSTDTAHVYRHPGIYYTKVTVTDKDGASSSLPLWNAVWVYDPADNHPVAGYDVIDLGTLGGDLTSPVALNNLGEVIGSSTTAGATSHAFLWRNGVLSDINPPGELGGQARVITDEGLILGGTLDGQLPMWRNGNLIGFVTVPQTEYGGWPVRVSASGDVLVNLEGHEFPDAHLVRGGTAIKLTKGHSAGVDMNSHEQVVGWIGIKYIGESAVETHAFVWDDGVVKDLGSIGTGPCSDTPEAQCGYSSAYDINESGQIVGTAYDGNRMRAVLWGSKDSLPRDLEFGTGSSSAVAINEKGQIAGAGEGEGFFRENGTVTRLGSLGGGGTLVEGMNEQGVVAGTSITASGEVHAFVWTRTGGMRDLGAGPFGAPGVGTIVVDINDRGDILGYAVPCAVTYQGYCGGQRPVRAILWRSTN
jgi:probable HAF family extracellular repeat protein